MEAHLIFTELQQKIVLLLTDNIPRIQNEIVDKLGYDHKSNTYRTKISREMKYLKESKLIQQVPHDNIQGKAWTLNDAYFIELLPIFVITSKSIEFHYSAYCQGMINQKLIEMIKKAWNYPKDCELTDIKKPLNEYLQSYLSDKELVDILKNSPSALKTAIVQSGDNKNFIELMLLKLISDVKEYNLPVNLNFYLRVVVRYEKFRIDKKIGEEIYNMPPDAPFKVQIDLK